MNIYYLYKKTHNKTGLQYLGQTSQLDPHKYPGSGTRWVHHLKKHGYDYTTEILKECVSKDDLKLWGLYYSKLWNVANSNEWANLKLEEGDGGKPSIETIEKIRKALTGRVQTNDHRIKNSEAHKGKNNIMYGKTHTIEARSKISEARKGKPTTLGKSHTAQSKQKTRESIKALSKIKCCHCSILSHPNNHGRWHGDNCKLKTSEYQPTA